MEGLGGPIYQPVPLAPFVGGVVTEYPPDVIEDHQLASANNILIRDGVPTQRPGYETLLSSALTSTPLTGIEFIPFDQSARLVVGALTKMYYSTGGGVWDDITGTARTGTISNPPFFVPMRTATGLPLITVNGVDPPAWWSGATSATFQYMTTAVIGACATVWRSHFVQGDVTTSADGRVAARVQWSALGLPQVWSGTASTGTIDLVDENASRVQLFLPMRGNLLAYKDEGVHALIYKADPFYFTQTLLHGGLSCLSRRAACAVQNGDQHVVVTKENIILWDGQSIQRIGDPIRRDVYDALNWNARDTIFAYYAPLTEEVIIGIPTGSNTRPNVAWVYHLRYGSWWQTDLDFLGMLYVTKAYSPPRLLGLHPAVNKIYHVFSGLGDGTGATAITSSLQTKLYDFGQAPYHKAVKQMAVLLGMGTGTTTTVSIEKAGVENPLATLTFASAQTLLVTSTTQEPKIDFRLTNKYLSFRLQHSAASETVAVHRFVPYVQPRPAVRKDRT